MGHLRNKLDRPFGRASIETVRGAGYRAAADGADAPARRRGAGVRVRTTVAAVLVVGVVLVLGSLAMLAFVERSLVAQVAIPPSSAPRRCWLPTGNCRPTRIGARSSSRSIRDGEVVAGSGWAAGFTSPLGPTSGGTSHACRPSRFLVSVPSAAGRRPHGHRRPQRRRRRRGAANGGRVAARRRPARAPGGRPGDLVDHRPGAPSGRRDARGGRPDPR